MGEGCIVDVIIPTNLVCVPFDPAIPTSSFNFIVFILLVTMEPLNKYTPEMRSTPLTGPLHMVPATLQN